MTVVRAMALTTCAISASAFSAASIAQHSWSNYHWERAANPVGLTIVDNVDSNWDDYLGTAEVDWDMSSVLTIAEAPGTGDTKPCKAEAGLVNVCNDRYGYNGWLGIAGISVSGDHITAAYTKMNDSYFASATYNTPAWRQMVICQEIGHTFGLDHQDEDFNNDNLGTCMDYTNDPSSNQHPNQHDYDELVSIYAHDDSSSVGGGGGSGGSGCNPKSPKCNGLSAADILASIEMSGPAQWGRLVSQHGPQEVYELDFGGGRKIITYVTWTLERAYNHQH